MNTLASAGLWPAAFLALALLVALALWKSGRDERRPMVKKVTRCAKCGYPLTGLVTCPECGT